MSEPWDEAIGLATVLTLYTEGITRYGGVHSAPQDGCVEGSLGAAWTAEQYRAEAGIALGLLFAAYAFFYLARNHCFVDGNKRVAWSCLIYILFRNGLTVRATDDEAVAIRLSTACNAEVTSSSSVLRARAMSGSMATIVE